MSYDTPLWSHRSPRLFAASLVTLVIALAAMPGIARAGEFSGKLTGKTWTSSGAVGSLVSIAAEELTYHERGICVGPVQWNGSSWVFPYGWDCGNDVATWSFPAIEAAAGVDNPNSSTFKFWADYAF